MLIISVSGCGTTPKPSDTNPQSSQLTVLEVENGQYTFFMYPEYRTSTNSLLKLAIRNQGGQFVAAKQATADLTAEDGDKQSIAFTRNPEVGNYIANVPLRHHEDYSIQTDITLENGEHYSPKFSFHCGDPLPQLYDAEPGAGEQPSK